ncbi:MAG: hypothetical protein WD151_08495, partial [Phycisphaeraceae bacterium]
GYQQAMTAIMGEPVQVLPTAPEEIDRYIPWLPGPVRVVPVLYKTWGPGNEADSHYEARIIEGDEKYDDEGNASDFYNWRFDVVQGLRDREWRETMEALVTCVQFLLTINGSEAKGGTCPFCQKVYKIDGPLKRHVFSRDGCAGRRGIDHISESWERRMRRQRRGGAA